MESTKFNLFKNSKFSIEVEELKRGSVAIDNTVAAFKALKDCADHKYRHRILELINASDTKLIVENFGVPLCKKVETLWRADNKIGKFKEMSKQILEGYSVLYESNIVHNDVSLSNIMIMHRSKNIKLKIRNFEKSSTKPQRFDFKIECQNIARLLQSLFLKFDFNSVDDGGDVDNLLQCLDIVTKILNSDNGSAKDCLNTPLFWDTEKTIQFFFKLDMQDSSNKHNWNKTFKLLNEFNSVSN